MNPIHSKSFKLSERKQNGKKVLTYPAKENGEKSLAVFLVKRKRNDEVVIFNRRQMERCFGIGFNLFPRGLKTGKRVVTRNDVVQTSDDLWRMGGSRLPDS
jgi:hypothetical protein